jgi:predicted amidohydrolase
MMPRIILITEKRMNSARKACPEDGHTFKAQPDEEKQSVRMKVQLGLVQMRTTTKRDENLKKAVAMVGEAAEKGAKIVCLPELFDSRYFPQKEVSDAAPERLPSATSESLAAAAERNRVVLVGGSLFERYGGKSYNTSLVFDEHGNELGRYRKVHIPQDPSFYEKDYFSPGGEYRVFETRYGKLGVLICFDQWYPEPARVSKLLGAEMLFYPTAIGAVRGIEQVEGSWQDAWETVQRGHAIANSVVVAAVNRVGVEDDMEFWGAARTSRWVGDSRGTADRRHTRE